MTHPRKRAIAAIEDLLVVNQVDFLDSEGPETEVNVGTWRTLLLKNRYTTGLCHIFECVYNPNVEKDEGIAEHVHDTNDELFYQLTGVTYFGDGDILKEGEVKIIRAKTPHSCKMSSDGACIVIVHPPFDSGIIPKLTSKD